ncbi:MAG: DUF3500 domain-containing protein [Gemmatimonadota bacterium]|nr:DUF3500 domain-containing protein [Gemmatimonadota bacterium]
MSELRPEVYRVAPTRDGETPLAMDLYLPADRPAKGAVVLIHGGSFVTGSREIEENVAYGTALAERGYVAASISYRLHGDRPVVDGWARRYSRWVGGLDDPRMASALERFGREWTDAVAAASEDVVAAVEWLRERAGELGYAPDDVALFGASAGAIASLTAVYAREAYGSEDLDVAGVIALRALFLRPPGEANPFEPDDPPLLIFHGEADRRVPLADAESLFELAREAGLAVEIQTAPGYGHELGGEALLGLRLDSGGSVLDRIDAFLERAFGRVPRCGGGRAGGPARLRSELATAVSELVRSVREEDDFVASLYGIDKAELLVRDFDDPTRVDWSYWPRERTGLPLEHMTAEQREQTHRILSTLLSSKGYLQVNHVVLLEEVLAQLETVGFTRGVGEYAVTVFGDPTTEPPRGLRFEGHHVSLNVTLGAGGISVTPSFLGASPAPVQTGIRAGLHPLRYEQRHAIALLESLDEGQREAAILADRPPDEILTTQFRVDRAEWGRWEERLSRDGVPASTFDARQRELLRRLLAEIVGTYRDEIARPRLDSLDLDSLAFAWMGEPAIGRPHYFRIQGKSFVFELDAVQGDGTHVHTVWRERGGDFGEDLLRDHRRRHH